VGFKFPAIGDVATGSTPIQRIFLVGEKHTEAGEEKRKGRRAFVPTNEQRARVAAMLGAGAQMKDIADAVGVSMPTFRTAFAAEVEAAKPDPGPDLFAAAGDMMPPLPTRQPLPRRKTGGRPRYKPTDKDRADVTTMAALGTRPSIMARQLKISVPTLTKIFAVELADALEVERAKNAILLREAAEAGNVSAMKARADELDRRAADQAARAFAPKQQQATEPVLGKKEQAQVDAVNAIKSEDGWGGVISQAVQASRIQ
jgi:hypothetical protein